MGKKGKRKKDAANSLGLLVGGLPGCWNKETQRVGLRSKEIHMEQIARGKGHERRKWNK